MPAGHPDAEPARHAGRKASAAQADEAAVPGSTRHDHGQIGQLQSGQARGDAMRGAQEAQRPEQQGGELAPAHPTAKAADEAVQVSRPSPAFLVCPRWDQQSFPPPPVDFRAELDEIRPEGVSIASEFTAQSAICSPWNTQTFLSDVIRIQS